MNSEQILELARKRVDSARVELHSATQTRKSEETVLVTAETALADALEAQKITQLVAQSVQQRAHISIAAVVTRSLQAVFGAGYSFKIIFEQRAGRTHARLAFEQDGHEIDPREASAGGVIDVAAFSLRLSALLLSRPKRRRFLVLDEPFKNVSDEYLDGVRAMLEQLSRELHVQILMVTHIPDLKMGTVIQL